MATSVAGTMQAAQGLLSRSGTWVNAPCTGRQQGRMRGVRLAKEEAVAGGRSPADRGRPDAREFVSYLLRSRPRTGRCRCVLSNRDVPTTGMWRCRSVRWQRGAAGNRRPGWWHDPDPQEPKILGTKRSACFDISRGSRLSMPGWQWVTGNFPDSGMRMATWPCRNGTSGWTEGDGMEVSDEKGVIHERGGTKEGQFWHQGDGQRVMGEGGEKGTSVGASAGEKTEDGVQDTPGAVTSSHVDPTDWLGEGEREGKWGPEIADGYRGWSSFVVVESKVRTGAKGGESEMRLKGILSKGIAQVALGLLLGICLTAASFQFSQRRVVLAQPGAKGFQLHPSTFTGMPRLPLDNRAPTESEEVAQLARKFRTAAAELFSMLEQRGKKGAVVKPMTEEEAQRLQKAADIASKQMQTGQVTDKISKRVEDKLTKMRREYLLREQMKAIKEELGDSEDDDMILLERRLEEAKMPPSVWKHVQRELRLLKKMQPRQVHYGPERAYLELLADLPWAKSSEERDIDLNEARKKLDEDHYGLAKVKKRIIEYLAVRKLKPDAAGPILCFVGPPGVGKTSLASSIAEVLGRKFIRISLGGIRDEADIRGHRRTYISSYPGRLIDGVKKVAVNNPVMLLDEIDKIGADMRGDPEAALLEVLDPEQNMNFTDHYLNVPFDLSKVVFLATANRSDPITPPLLDRMEVIELSGYTSQEKVGIATRHLLPRVLERHGLSEKHLQIPEEMIMFIVQRYTREAGVRDLERNLAAVCRSVAVTVSERMAVAKKRKEQRRRERKELEALAKRSAVTDVAGQEILLPSDKENEGDVGVSEQVIDGRGEAGAVTESRMEGGDVKGQKDDVKEKESDEDAAKSVLDEEIRETAVTSERGFQEAMEKVKRRLGERGGLLVVVLDARGGGIGGREEDQGSSAGGQLKFGDPRAHENGPGKERVNANTVKDEDDFDEADNEAEEEIERLIVDEKIIENVLGPPKRDGRETEDRVASPGVAIGLVRTEYGGDILFVEATLTNGNGELILTGRLGDMTKESAKIAMTWVRARVGSLLRNKDLHVHFPEGAVPKDGPSAGVTMVTSLVSLLTKQPVRSDTAMTGEITLRGIVLPVGGIKEKVLAAHRCGIKRVIIPDRNVKDLREVPAEVLSSIEVIPVKMLEQVLENVFDAGSVLSLFPTMDIDHCGVSGIGPSSATDSAMVNEGERSAS